MKKNQCRADVDVTAESPSEEAEKQTPTAYSLLSNIHLISIHYLLKYHTSMSRWQGHLQPMNCDWWW